MSSDKDEAILDWQRRLAVTIEERDKLRVEVERLREQLDEWESVNVAQVELRGLVESHMDMARGQWECVAEVERLEKALEQMVDVFGPFANMGAGRPAIDQARKILIRPKE